MRYICLSLYPNLTFSTLCSVLRALFSVCGTQLVCTRMHVQHVRRHKLSQDRHRLQSKGAELALNPRTGVPYPAIMGAHGANA